VIVQKTVSVAGGGEIGSLRSFARPRFRRRLLTGLPPISVSNIPGLPWRRILLLFERAIPTRRMIVIRGGSLGDLQSAARLECHVTVMRLEGLHSDFGVGCHIDDDAFLTGALYHPPKRLRMT